VVKLTDNIPNLPLNSLDRLIVELGGPDRVAELTGRSMRMIQRHGAVSYESRKSAGVSIDMVNVEEKNSFMNGDKVRQMHY